MRNGKEITSAAINLIRGLIFAAVIGVAGIAATQIALVSRVETTEAVQKKNQPIIDSVDVMQKSIEDLEKDFEKLNTKIDAQHTEVLDAIRAAR